ncbi:zinc-binding dehydrogenase [Amycolatopsis sp. NPDC051903]|uniref:zinc-binding dehydrogenase n=1 Tax=Amycolatopsis sp. NPDC051903 TaxID=3363936 RepID=UPI0037BD6886
MRVVTWQAIETLSIDEVAAPGCGPSDVVVSVGACGICGSDVHSYTEGAWIAPGVPLGHEYAGTVTAAGARVSGVSVGDRVAVNPAAPCGSCPRCAEGRHNLCSAGSGHSGGFGDQVVVRDAVVGQHLFVLPADFPLEEAAFLEPLSVAVRAVEHAEPPLDEPIVVFGLGTIGQCVVQVLLARGARDVIVVDTSPRRLAAALAAGAHEGLNPADSDVRASLFASRGTTASPYQPSSGAVGAVFECSGAAPVLPLAFSLARAAAPISAIALAAHPLSLPVDDLVQKELRLLGSFAYTARDCQEAFDLLVSRRVDVRPLISHRFALADIKAAFEAQRDPATSIKVVVSP